MATMVLQVCLLAVLSLSQCAVGFFNEYTMDQYCGMTLNIGSMKSSFKLKLTDNSYHDRHMNCSMHIKANDIFNRSRFYVQYSNYVIDCNDRLQFYDGSSDSSPEVENQLCSRSKSLPFATTGDDLFVKFTGDGSHPTMGFTLFINTFHTGMCKSNEFSCNNGRCIDYDLYCNLYDNCGDNSDFCHKDHNWWIWMVIGIVVFIVICVVITVICCCVCRKRTPCTVIKAGTQPVVHYQTETQAAQANSWYGAPTQPMGVQGTYPPGPTLYQPPVMQPPPAYTNASGSAVYPPPQSAAPGLEANAPLPPPYSEKM